MTPLTIDCWINVPVLFQGLADLLLREFCFLRKIAIGVMRLAVFRDKCRRLHVVRFPIEIENLFLRPEKFFRMPVAVETPSHAVRLGVLHRRHVIDLAVTTETTDPAVNVRGVIVKNVIGRAMKLHPLDRLARLPTRAHRLQFWIVLLHLLVAIHAGLRVRQVRMRRHFDKAVTITAIHPELRNVDVVRERHRLDRLITDARVFRRDVVPCSRRQTASDKHAADGHLQRHPIGPAREKIGHKQLADAPFAQSQPPT
jgi:hypothetical protein